MCNSSLAQWPLLVHAVRHRGWYQYALSILCPMCAQLRHACKCNACPDVPTQLIMGRNTTKHDLCHICLDDMQEHRAHTAALLFAGLHTQIHFLHMQNKTWHHEMHHPSMDSCRKGQVSESRNSNAFMSSKWFLNACMLCNL